MSFFDRFGKSTKQSLNGLLAREQVISLKDLLDLDEIQTRHQIVDAARTILLNSNHSQDGYNILGPLAAEGDVEAQFAMGEFCEDVLDRPEQAAIWFGRAADQGMAKAQRNYADMLMAGKGIPQNPTKAARYYESAANSGISEAQFVMGEFYRNGHFVPKDDAKAIFWYQKARNQGYDHANARLLKFYPNAMK